MWTREEPVAADQTEQPSVDDDKSFDLNGDGIPDGNTLDQDEDGEPDPVDVDGDGIPDGVAVDLNGDGVPDGVGYDTDNDGIIDVIGIDLDGDGRTDGIDLDGDGVPDADLPDWILDLFDVESNILAGSEFDLNGDGLPDGMLFDHDGDGQPDLIDWDGDGVPDGYAIDTDGDGVPDGVGYDLDGDGDIDGVGVDTDGDGDLDGVDTNGDGNSDGEGLDFDGDGLTDGVGLDANGDGQIDGVDTDGDGNSNGFPIDTNGDGIPDGLDTDGDGDIDETGGGNHAPVAVNDEASSEYGQTTTVSVLSNDSDPDGDAISITGHTQPSHGTLTPGSSGQLVYTPNPGYSGTDSFSYTISDGRGLSATATVHVAIAVETKVRVIWVEGTTPPVPGLQFGPLESELVDKLKTTFANKSVVFHEFQTVASPLTPPANHLPAFSPVAAGRKLIDAVDAIHRQNPTDKYVIVGYSFGARAVLNALREAFYTPSPFGVVGKQMLRPAETRFEAVYTVDPVILDPVLLTIPQQKLNVPYSNDATNPATNKGNFPAGKGYNWYQQVDTGKSIIFADGIVIRGRSIAGFANTVRIATDFTPQAAGFVATDRAHVQMLTQPVLSKQMHDRMQQDINGLL